MRTAALNALLKKMGTVFIVCARLSNTVPKSQSRKSWDAAWTARGCTATSTADSSTSSWTASVPGRPSVSNSPPTESGLGSGADGSGLPFAILGGGCGLGSRIFRQLHLSRRSGTPCGRLAHGSWILHIVDRVGCPRWKLWHQHDAPGCNVGGSTNLSQALG